MHNRCPMCNGQGNELGNLGRLLWFRCEDCGAEFSVDDQETDYDQED